MAHGREEGRVAHAQEGWETQLTKIWQGLAVPSVAFAGSVASEHINQRLTECVSQLASAVIGLAA